MLANEKPKKGKVYYYSDLLNDDFETTNLKRNPLPKDYKYIRGRIFNFFSFLLYYMIAVPVLTIVCFFCGVRVKGKKNLRKVKKEGAFLYMNHTSFLDTFVVQCYVQRFKRTHIIGYTDALDLPCGISFLTQQLGYLPLPTSVSDYKKFDEALKHFIGKKRNILIFPEAHIWPYYNKIRPFISTSFKYAAKLSVPVVPLVTCYRKSKISSKAIPVIYIGEPIYPKKDLNINQNKEYLRDECYKVMCDFAEKYSTYEYCKFVYKEKETQDENKI